MPATHFSGSQELLSVDEWCEKIVDAVDDRPKKTRLKAA